MMKKEKTLRIALSCALLLAVAAAGVTMYRSENSVKKQDENQAEEQQMVLTDGYFQRMVDECYEPGTVFPNVAADCARCCELAGEIACVITGRDRL